MGSGVRDADVRCVVRSQCDNTLYIHPGATSTPTQPETNLPNELAKNILFLPKKLLLVSVHDISHCS